MGIGDKIATFVQWVTTFFAGYTVGFIQGWQLTLVILAVAPLMVITVGVIAVVRQPQPNNVYSSQKKEPLSPGARFCCLHLKKSEITQRMPLTASVGSSFAFANGFWALFAPLLSLWISSVGLLDSCLVVSRCSRGSRCSNSWRTRAPGRLRRRCWAPYEPWQHSVGKRRNLTGETIENFRIFFCEASLFAHDCCHQCSNTKWVLRMCCSLEMKIKGTQRISHSRYRSRLDGAKMVGIKRGLVTGCAAGLIWVLIFGAFALAFWYGTQLVINEGYEGGDILQVS